MTAVQAAEIPILSSRKPTHKSSEYEHGGLQCRHPGRSSKQLQFYFRTPVRCSQSAVTQKAFDEIPHSSTFSYNSLIQRYLNDGGQAQAIASIYAQMLARGIRPDRHTLPRVLTAARLLGSFFYAKSIHAHAVKLGFASDGYVITSLMTMYAKFDGLETAKRLLDTRCNKNSVSWTLLAELYAMENKHESALQLFHEMVSSGVQIDSVALASAIKACRQLKSVRDGRRVHEIAKQNGLEFDLLVGNALLKMYFDMGNIAEAHSVFNSMPEKDVISWTAIINGYVQNGGFNEGFKLFRTMNAEGYKADSFTIASILPACARLSARKNGKETHGYLLRHGIELNLTVKNSLVDMYMKSGSMESASTIFERMEERDLVSWTVMILGFSLHGKGELGIELFHEMQESKVEPDMMAYAAVLHACRIARMAEVGKLYFNCIEHPKLEHMTSMVGLLARAGQLSEAQAFMSTCQIEQYPQVQRALLEGCRIHQDTLMGKRVVDKLTELEPLNADNYVMLSNYYAANGKWEMVDRLRETIIDMGLKPKKAYSWIEVRNKFHAFEVGDVSHPRSERIYWELESLTKRMKDEGYVPESDFTFHDVDEERDCIPHGHSEMLAVAFGLICAGERTPIRVTKNLRVCRNCHAYMKFLSKMVDQDIVLKDPNQFHHFKQGFCSCGDFW